MSPNSKKVKDDSHVVHTGATKSKKYADLNNDQELTYLIEDGETYKRIFSDAIMGIFLAEKNGRIMTANSAMVKLCGYNAEKQLTAMSDIATELFKNPDDKKYVIKQLTKNGTILAYETKLKKQDGTFVDVLLNAKMQKSASYEYFECFVNDLTQSKKTENAFHDSEANIQSVFRAAPVGIGVVVDRIISKVNEKFCEITKYASDELLGQSARLLYPSDEDFEYVGREKYRQIAECGTGTVETFWKRKDGIVIDVLLSSTPIDQSDYSKGVTFTALDITARKKAETESIEKEMFLNRVIDQSPFGTWISDANGVLIRANQTLRDTLNVTDAQLIGKYNVLEDVAIKDQGHGELVKSVYENGTKASFEMKWYGTANTTSDLTGSTALFLEVTLFPVFNSENKLTNVVCIWIDITDRKLAEEKLIKSEERFRRLAENAPDMIYRMSLPDGKYEYVSPVSTEMFGYTPEEFVNSPLLIKKVVHPDFNDYFNEQWEALIAGEIRPFYEYKVIHAKTKEVRWLHQRNMFILDENGLPVTIEGIVTDVTERKKQEVELSKLRNYLDNIINSMPSVIIGVDTDCTVTQWNAKAESISRIAASEALGQPLERIYQNLVAEMPQVKDAISRKEVVSILGRSSQIDGITKFEDITVYPLTTGNTSGAVIRIDDVTEEHERDSMLRHQQKLESIGTLAGGVAHEINNPINIIMNYGQLIIEQVEKNSQIETDANEIVQESMRIAEIVKNLLSFSRQDEEQHSLARIEDIITSTLMLTNKILGKDQIKVNTYIEPDLPQIKCRSQQIMQVIMNLLTNARDALNESYPDYDDNKIINVTSKLITQEGYKWVQTTIEDYGTGIPDKIKDRIFDPFFTSKDRDKGTGLGLSVSYGIVKEHQGKMEVETCEGESTRFHLYLPIDNGWFLETEKKNNIP